MEPNNSQNTNGISGALTYPVNNENLQPLPEQPRQPRTMQGLLRFAMEATKAEDAPHESQFRPLDEESRRFLDNVLNSHTVRISEILTKNIKVLTDVEKINSIKAGDPLPEDVLLAFQELGEYIDDIDVANDFDTLGGFAIFPLCHSSDNAELHRWANLTLAQVCQNNPRCQARALQDGLLDVLLQRLRGQAQDRSLRALSSMVRNFEATTRAFVQRGGCEALGARLRGAGGADGAELTSAAFLLAYLCKNSREAREILIKNNIIQTVVDTLKAGRTDTSEYLLNILVTLIEAQPDLAPAYKDPALGLREVLENHLKIEDVHNGRFIEEKEHCEKIIQLAFENVANRKPDPVYEEDVEPADR